MASILPHHSNISSMAESKNGVGGDSSRLGTTTATGASTSAASSTTSEQNISYAAERIIGNGSFGVVFEAKVVETGEVVAIKKVLQDKRFKNRELQIMRQLVKDPHPNIVALKHCFYSQVSALIVEISLSRARSLITFLRHVFLQITREKNRMTCIWTWSLSLFQRRCTQ